MCKVPPDTLRAPTIAVGFSVRALVDAITADFAPPLAVDHFADHDCYQTATAVVRLAQWGGKLSHSTAFLSQLSQAGAQPLSRVLLAGGTENWPELVELLQQHFTLLGPSVEQLLELRSPQRWQRWAEQSRIAFPELRWLEAAPAHDFGIGDWLIKPLRGAGGYAIKRASQLQNRSSMHSRPIEHAADETLLPSAYWQRHIEGRSVGVYCVLSSDSSVELLGATESLTAAQWPGPSEFIYRGSLGPIGLPWHHRRRIVDLCQLIQRQTRMLGWLQLDFIEDLTGELWLLELNPRWTAGMEILFLAGTNPVERHCRVWPSDMSEAQTGARQTGAADTNPHAIPSANATPSIPADTGPGVWQGEVSFGKAVVYAPYELVLTHHSIAALHNLPGDNFADLPSHQLIADDQSAYVVATGQPVLTVRASGPHVTLVEQLAELRETALALLGGRP